MSDTEELVPDDVIPHRHLPPLRYRELPEPLPWRRMVGPSIILAGLALGSGEYILWPNIVYHSGFIFFWACLLGVVTQFFINMEIERWTLVTGESAITGFSRLSRQWAWIFLILNIVPWAFPGWSTAASELLLGLFLGPDGGTEPLIAGTSLSPAGLLSIGSLVACGAILTAGPIVYNTVERLQMFLVGMILALAAIIGCMVIRPDAWVALGQGVASVGSYPDLETTGLTSMQLLGALAFAGAGGTLNLGQSSYIKDKGYGMGKYLGRIVSPLTGQEEAAAETGFHFRHTPENMQRWRGWWRAANIEHGVSFLGTCVVCLALLSLIAYSLLYDEQGVLKSGAEELGSGMRFVWGQAEMLGERPFGGFLRYAYLIAGVAILLTTELGVLDGTARISADIVKVNYLLNHPGWTVSRLYSLFLWGEILLGSLILLFVTREPLLQVQLAAAMNGAVMFLYSLLLLYLNTKILSRSLSIGPARFLVLVWSCAFFGYFTLQAAPPFLKTIWGLVSGGK